MTAAAAQKNVPLKRQTLTGVVVSNKMKDAVVVKIQRFVMHPKYRKYQSRHTKLMARDAGNTKKIGDTATIEACRPISKRIAFKVVA